MILSVTLDIVARTRDKEVLWGKSIVDGCLAKLLRRIEQGYMSYADRHTNDCIETSENYPTPRCICDPNDPDYSP